MQLRRHAACSCLALLLVAAAGPARQAPPSIDAAGNRMTPFPLAAPAASTGGSADPAALRCSADRRWCARLRGDESGTWRLELSEDRGPARRLDVAGEHDEDSEFAIWPWLVREAGGAVLVGVELTRRTGYSGGGASATRLVLVRAEPGTAPLRAVLDVPLQAQKDIRACFGARDMRRRRGACSDQYEFAGTLSLDPATRTGRPAFLLAARARTYPGRRSLDSDSTTAPPLRAADLRWTVDPGCTYRRRLAFDPGAGRYLPDRPLPACTDYLDF